MCCNKIPYGIPIVNRLYYNNIVTKIFIIIKY